MRVAAEVLEEGDQRLGGFERESICYRKCDAGIMAMEIIINQSFE